MWAAANRGRIAFDGDFDQLRRRFADRRLLRLQTRTSEAPPLQGAELLGSEGGWHEYRFDAGRTEIVALLEEARTHVPILDVETHRAPIDEVIADLYQQWR